MSERRHRIGRRLALKRLIAHANYDARNVEDEGLVGDDKEADPTMVQQALLSLARELEKRVEKIDL